MNKKKYKNFPLFSYNKNKLIFHFLINNVLDENGNERKINKTKS